MVASFTAACIQMNSGDDVADNLRRAGNLLQLAADGGAQLAALPEYFPLLTADETRKLAIAEQEERGVIQDFLANAAARLKLYLIGGAIPIRADNNKVLSRCLLYAPDGKQIAHYDKIHLFRFDDKVDETTTIERGSKVVSVNTPLGKIGLAICYDARFPELFRAMETPDIIVIPSAFTVETGAAHWRLLMRARAVENLAHVIAPAQAGEHPGGRKTFGDSIIIDSWGRILAAASCPQDDVIFANIDNESRAQQRARLPALNHRLI